ncbi:MAG: hypothetical protein JNL34_09510 [Anaerolineae bacterium]|nr:hypothetical protein [Anaerolineae bacterium]
MPAGRGAGRFTQHHVQAGRWPCRAERHRQQDGRRAGCACAQRHDPSQLEKGAGNWRLAAGLACLVRSSGNQPPGIRFTAGWPMD